MNRIIGITADWAEDPRGSLFARHELRAAYVEAVARSGGVPVILPTMQEPRALDPMLEKLSGLVLTGGAFDIPPALYGEEPAPGLGPLKPQRTEFERHLLESALRRDLPVLGICGGLQLINVALGGTLYQHLPDQLAGALAHEQVNDRREVSHRIEIEPGTLLSQILSSDHERSVRRDVWVNSSHHQGIRTLGAGLRASAYSADGLVEAIERPGGSFLLGVEWHPELLIETQPIQLRIFQALVEAG